jgi:flagellar hook-associated protein 3 FlgL
MRISTNYIYENTRRTIQQSTANLLKAQEVMATQRRINRLSDDPVGAGRVLNVERMISQNDQFVRNLDTANTLAQLYDGSFDSTLSLLQRAKELVVGETNSAVSTPETRQAARVEIVSLASQLVSIANLQYGDRFLFAGYLDSTAPFLDQQVSATAAPGNTGAATVAEPTVSNPAAVTRDTYEIRFTDVPPMTYDVVDTTTGVPVISGAAYTPGAAIQFDGVSLRINGAPAGGDVFTVTTAPAGAYVGDSGIVRLEVDQDVFEQTNFTGDSVFQGAGTAGGVDLFGLFERVNAALRSNDQTALAQTLDDLDAASAQMTRIQSQAGSRENLFENTKERLLDVKLNMQVLLSDLRDADITEAVTELNRQENAYQAVLGATAKILQPNLLDFLS